MKKKPKGDDDRTDKLEEKKGMYIYIYLGKIKRTLGVAFSTSRMQVNCSEGY